MIFALKIYVIFLVFVISGAIYYTYRCRRRIFDLFGSIDRRSWFVLITILLAAILVRTLLFHQSHMVYYDEFEHMSIAENLKDTGNFALCFDGTSSECHFYKEMPWPGVFHILLATAYRIFGNYEVVAFGLNLVLGLSSIISMFFLCRIVTGKDSFGLLSSGIISLNSLHARVSDSTAIEMISFLFIMLSLIVFMILISGGSTQGQKKSHQGSDGTDILVLFVLMLVIAINCRPENILLVPFYAIAFWLYRKEIHHPALPAKIFLSMLLIASVSFSLLLDVIGKEGWRISPDGPLRNLASYALWNLSYLFNPRSVGFLFALSFVISIMLLIHSWLQAKGRVKKRVNLQARVHVKYSGGDYRKPLIPVLLFMFLFFTVSSYYKGIFVSSNERYALVLMIPLVTLFCMSLDFITGRFHRHKRMMSIISVSLLIISSAYGLSQRVSPDPMQDVYLLLRDSADAIGDNYVICSNPSIVQTTIGKKSVSPNILMLWGEKPDKIFLVDDKLQNDHFYDSFIALNFRNHSVRDIKSIGKVRLLQIEKLK